MSNERKVVETKMFWTGWWSPVCKLRNPWCIAAALRSSFVTLSTYFPLDGSAPARTEAAQTCLTKKHGGTFGREKRTPATMRTSRRTEETGRKVRKRQLRWISFPNWPRAAALRAAPSGKRRLPSRPAATMKTGRRWKWQKKEKRRTRTEMELRRKQTPSSVSQTTKKVNNCKYGFLKDVNIFKDGPQPHVYSQRTLTLQQRKNNNEYSYIFLGIFCFVTY